MSKETLDKIIEKHKGQPVGNGYIDIIVSRDKYKGFVKEVINNNFKIKCISWWEWCIGNERNIIGHGGPMSQFYDGWFAELCTAYDDLKQDNDQKKEDVINEIINKVEAKTIHYSFLNNEITFGSYDRLTPAFWLDVPDSWRNKVAELRHR